MSEKKRQTKNQKKRLNQQKRKAESEQQAVGVYDDSKMLKQIKKQNDLEDLEDDEIDARDFIGNQTSTNQNSSVLF